MSTTTKIEWTDRTWNPVTGCTKVSPGCDNCYAETFAERWRGTPGHPYEQGFDVQLRPERLDQPLRWRKPSRVFVNSMSDLFHDAVPDEFIVDVFARMWWSPQHTFQILTKRHGRMRSLVPRIKERLRKMEHDLALVDAPTPLHWPLPNVWLGCSVENQQWADIRIPALLETPAAVRFLSCEPLLGPVDLTPWINEWNRSVTHSTANPTHILGPYTDGHDVDHIDCDTCEFDSATTGLHWIIAGGESGHGARPMHPDWARTIRDACEHSGVPFFMKQLGSHWGKRHKDIDQFPTELRVRDFPKGATHA